MTSLSSIPIESGVASEKGFTYSTLCSSHMKRIDDAKTPASQYAAMSLRKGVERLIRKCR